jgi:hypothetical protein
LVSCLSIDLIEPFESARLLAKLDVGALLWIWIKTARRARTPAI